MMSCQPSILAIQSFRQEADMIEVSAYPNPVSDVLYFDLKHKMGNYTDKVVRAATLTNLEGQLLYQKLFTKGDEYRINIPVALRGMFILKLTDNDGEIHTKKILINKEL
ncbi:MULTISPECIES: T9SS type A sorting domain-containing protein [unclassified Chitinophaga]|uniref:T9SS type A sorting domain-containing protein n=1 Tax=unclassified Chitinophaga TaxID=2619133 RepID=UPI0015C31B17|nr:MULTISPECIES: T9SS type A sorting domain-containing protein [unclassified Chitinophaga]WPV66728.1 T9SS type A sorting domain-containing protein [Chitinophaga sp. LS1]